MTTNFSVTLSKEDLSLAIAMYLSTRIPAGMTVNPDTMETLTGPTNTVAGIFVRLEPAQ